MMKINTPCQTTRRFALSPRAMAVAGILGMMASAPALAVESAATTTVQGHAPTMTAEKVITVTEGSTGTAGLLDAGDTLTVDTSKLKFTDADGDTLKAYTYQWSVDGHAVSGTKGKGSSYVIEASDKDKPITLKITPTTDAGTTDPDAGTAVPATFARDDALRITDGATQVTTSPDGTVVSVRVDGINSTSSHPMVGDTLTAIPTCSGTAGTCTPTNLVYQWQIESTAGKFTDISGATAATFVPTKDDQKKALKVIVTMSASAPHPAPVAGHSRRR